MVFNVNISDISLRSDLLGENHQPVASHWGELFFVLPLRDSNSQHWYTAVPITWPYVQNPRLLCHIYYIIYTFMIAFSVRVMVFNVNISDISLRSDLLGENHQPVASHWQTLSHNVVHLALIEIRTHNIYYFNRLKELN
jgi:hypothetical protein